MKIIKTTIEGLLILQPQVYSDERGYFFESFRHDILTELGINEGFVQDNESKSQKGVLRGLHFQNPPYAQGKLIRVVKGAVLDVAVDIRKGSISFGKFFKIELNEENKSILWIPPGFAHGFVTLRDDTVFQYKCTKYYNKGAEGSILWNDPVLGIEWQISSPIISQKDADAPLFADLKSNF